MKKGNNTRERLLKETRMLMNKYGQDVTLSFLASEMDVTIGQITYHFANKDSLILGIAGEYQSVLTELLNSYRNKIQLLENYGSFLSQLLDLQFEYRCAIRYIFGASRAQEALFSQIDQHSVSNLNGIKSRLQAYVDNGDLDPSIIEEDNMETFLFQYVCLLNGWPGYYEIYGYDQPYHKFKPTYYRGIVKLFDQYATPSGKEKIETLYNEIQ